jgi:ArsR family transcriptional regulator, zinc-responsive transcriptional repressor
MEVQSTVPRLDRRRLATASELLKTLAAPVRLAILVELDAGPRCVHDLVDALAVSQPLVSQHLRVLRAGRLVAAERRGREVVYQLVDEHVAHIVHDAIRHSEEDRV